MTRMDGLRALYDAVKAGRPDGEVFSLASPMFPLSEFQLFVRAYGQSVDAALAFIAATLPDAEVDRITQSRARNLWRVRLGKGSQVLTGEAAHLATALLLSALAALIAEVEAQP